AEALAAMSGHQDDASSVTDNFFDFAWQFRRPGRQFAYGPQQRVDDCIAGDNDFGRIDTLAQQILPTRRCGRKVQIAGKTYDPTVEFFGEGKIDILAA